MRQGFRGVFIVAAAATMSLVLASQAIALTWGPGKPLSANYGARMFSGSLAASTSALHVVFRQLDSDDRHVVYRRSTDGGTTWKAPVDISDPNGFPSTTWPSIAGDGNTVHVVWKERTTLLGSNPVDNMTGMLVYRRSNDSGATWSGSKRLSSYDDDIGFPTVAARGSTVLLAYTDRANGSVYVKRSTDGGATWKTRVKLGSTSYDYLQQGYELDGKPDIAFGNGVVYMVWMSSHLTVKVRRSLDGGATWAPAVTLETNARLSRGARIAADGSRAMVVYGYFDGTTNSYIAQVNTTDSGAHWTTHAKVSAGTKAAASQDVIRAGGRWRVAYRQCLDVDCETLQLWYRDSAAGNAWSTPALISINPSARPYVGDPTIAYAPTGTTWIGWSAGISYPFEISDPETDVYVRSGQ